MVAAALLSYLTHGYGPPFMMIMTWWVAWILLWWWWVRAGAGLVGAILSLTVFAAILYGPPEWQLGFELERGCLETEADAALERDEAGRTAGRAGRCGLMSWRSDVVRIRSSEAEDEWVPVVVFWGAGTTNWELFGSNAILFSPSEAPTRCRVLRGGSIVSCNVVSLGDGWYYQRHRTGLN